MGGLKVPLRDNPALNKIGPTCTPWIIFCTRVHLCAKTYPRLRSRPARLKKACVFTNQNQTTPRCVCGYQIMSMLTWPLIHHSGCGRNSCTATGRSSLGRQVHLWPRRAPGAERGTCWPTFTHTQLHAPSLRPLKSDRLAFFSHWQEYHPHGLVPPLRCPIVIRLLWVPR